MARELRRRITRRGQSEEDLVEVADLQTPIALALPGERARKTVCGGFVLVRNVRVLSELHLHRMSHLVRDDPDRGHIAVSTEPLGRGLCLPSDEDVVVVDRVAAGAV